MYIARLNCSDAECGEEITAESATLHELETLICDCGCALAIVGWPDATAEPPAEVVLLGAQDGAAALSHAA